MEEKDANGLLEQRGCAATPRCTMTPMIDETEALYRTIGEEYEKYAAHYGEAALVNYERYKAAWFDHHPRRANCPRAVGRRSSYFAETNCS
jgi:hypothetical protein